MQDKVDLELHGATEPQIKVVLLGRGGNRVCALLHERYRMLFLASTTSRYNTQTCNEVAYGDKMRYHQ